MDMGGREKNPSTYFMNKGRQGLLVAAATTDKETVDGSAVTVRLHGQLVRE